MRNNSSRILALLMGIVLLLSILAACGLGASNSSNGSPSTGSTTIIIGSDLPVSGKDASNGKPTENGVHLAIDEANANHTIPGYTLVFEPNDDVGLSGSHDPAVSAKNIRSFIGDALVAGVVGPFNSGNSETAMPAANLAPLALISPSATNPCITKNTPESGCTGANNLISTVRPTGKVTYFRIATTDDHQSTVIADYLFNNKGYKTAYVIDDTELYGVGIANGFVKEWKALGGTVLARQSEPPTTTSYISILTQAAGTKPDVIFCGCNDSTGGTLIRQQMLQVSGLQNTPFAAGDGIQTSSFASVIGTNGGQVYATVAAVNPDVLPAAQSFITKYKESYGAANYGAYSAGGYDCANILIQAIKTALGKGVHTPKVSSDAAGAKIFRQAVIDAIHGISYNGITGHHSFDANGDTTNKTISIYTLADIDGKPGWKFITQQSLT